MLVTFLVTIHVLLPEPERVIITVISWVTTLALETHPTVEQETQPILVHRHVQVLEILQETMRVTLRVIILGTLLVTMLVRILVQEFRPIHALRLAHVLLHILEQESRPILVDGLLHTQEQELPIIREPLW